MDWKLGKLLGLVDGCIRNYKDVIDLVMSNIQAFKVNL